MFYSQFILAKKGPLGTIWIAAHLERKLRKNQVSDTDIGVSVDSILFPEMPIALRLSSHLLLGVVRIYSKKVSYLFDDCSEALLKVKNAFRANAVDLPPEESTAPYHAITLPETFDLDDFELPDNENLQSGFVDHHVGAKEQITLQDTMEGVVYTTSEFGRDERFGDGEASHLDLNEELVVEKAATTGTTEDNSNTLNSNVDPQASTGTAEDNTLNSNVDPQAKTPLKDDEDHDAMSDDDGFDQMDDDSDGYDDGDADYVPDEYAEGPCTPGLWEQPNLPNIQETPTCDEESMKEKLENVPHQQEKSTPVVMGMEHIPMVTEYVPHQQEKSTPVVMGMEHTPMVTEYVPRQQEKSTPVVMGMEHVSMATEYVPRQQEKSTPVVMGMENVPMVTEYVPRQQEKSTLGSVVTMSEGHEGMKETYYENAIDKGRGVQSVVNDNRENWVKVQGNLENAYHPTSQLVSNPETLNKKNPEPIQLTNIPSFHSHSLQTSTINISRDSTFLQGQGSHATNTFDLNLQEINFTQSHDEDHVAYNLPNQLNNTNSYTSHFTGPERLLASQETSSNVTQHVHDTSNLYTPQFSTTERLLPVQERFSDVPQAYNTNIYTSQERLLPVQETFQDIPQQNNTNSYTSHSLLGVQERFQGNNNANIYTTSQFSGTGTLLGVQERFQDVNQGSNNNANSYTTSSHYPGTERLLAVQERVPDVVLPQSTPVQDNILRFDGGYYESDTRTGKKRGFDESSIVTKSFNLVEASGLLPTKTSAQSVQNNDVLSSILVGRPSDMKVKPTPPTKRQRQSLPKNLPKLPKTSVPKRKVPMDESTVLHGDVIRQQLTDTSDIRRPRKKVSCTWIELSMIHKQLYQDMIFHEALLTGVSIKLASLHNRSYDLRKIRVIRKETSSPALNPISQNDENDTNAPQENLHDTNKDVNDSEPFENNTPNPNSYETQEQINTTNEEITEPVNSESEPDGASQVAVDEKTDLPSVGADMDSSIDINSKYVDTKNDEIKVDIASQEKISEAKDEVTIVGPEIVSVDQEIEEIGKNEEELETLKPEIEGNEKNIEESCSKDVLLNDKENLDNQDALPETTNIEDNYQNNTADGDDLEYGAIGNNTDFLNFDDEEDNDGEEADEDLSDGEEKRLDDNSGWSSRTKAVSKYLQAMFDKEAENGRMALRMNSLLIGKTRKEASRMFFETLVLKTKDYIHVEQSEAFENIDILPRAKLLKSDF
ncbi:hypothetical protein L2E82_22658 [Cichorium intybus]|uniref:Uncharacterized protein n=1 Tax=Cichorium intybus TaxID=13427 RepID=A0ACB9DXU2_CICIN|nr:hypothetical protein L2E82_22658 [Cichorium intybus]